MADRAKRITAARLIAAIKGSDGIKARICKAAKVSHHTLNKWIRTSKSVGDAYELECGDVLAVAQSVVVGNIEAAAKTQANDDAGTKQVDSADAKWYLSKKGKHEGFGAEDTAPTVHIGITLGDWRKRRTARRKQVEEL